MKNDFTLLRKNLFFHWSIALLFNVLAVLGISAQTVIIDYESAGTSSNFSYFGNGAVGGSTTVIANPAPGGINTSANVGRFVKGANGEVWAGGAADPATSLNFTVHANACIKVWFAATGVLLFKAENPTNGSGSTWERLLPVTTANTWVELCFDGTLPDQGGGNSGPAIGRNFTRAVLFFDFGTSFPADHIYFFDDLRMTGTAPPPNVGNITFKVDMDGFANPFTTVFVSGSFNGWSQFGNPLSDPDMDNVWEATVPNIPFGQFEYKFQVDGWAAEESLTSGTPCTVTNFGFTNRFHNVVGNAVLPVVCWGSCGACGVAVTYCEALTTHFGIPAEVASGIKLTIANVNATTMYVQIESTTSDPVDLLIINGGSGAAISAPNTSVPGKISRTLTWATPPANVTLNVLWSKLTFGGNWQLSTSNITVPFAATCPFPPPPGAGAPPSFCLTPVFHFGNPAEVPSAAILTISNISPTMWIVEISSANADPVDLLLVVGAAGATISPPNTSVPGKITRTLTWVNAPANVNLNVLWSKVSFPGNWQLSQADITLPFTTTCAASIPTMGEWGLFLFGLIILAIGAVTVVNVQAKVQLAGTEGTVASASWSLPFNKANYFKSMKHAFGLALVGFAVIYVGWGEIVPADLFGMGFSVLIVSYLIHLLYKE